VTTRTSTTALTVGLLLVLAALSALSICLAFLASDSQDLLVILLRAPGRFLVDTFHLASLYVTAVFCIGAMLTLSDRLRHQSLLLLLTSIVPFFTLAAGLRLSIDANVEASRLTAYLSGAIGRPGAASATLLLGAIEVALLVLLWRRNRLGATAGSWITVGMEDKDTESRSGGRQRISELLRRITPGRRPESLIDLPEPAAIDRNDALTFHREAIQATESEETAEDLPETPLAQEESLFTYHSGTFYSDGLSEIDEVGEYDEEVLEEEDSAEEDGAEDPPIEQATVDIVSSPKRIERYHVPIEGILHEYSEKQYWEVDAATRQSAEVLRITLEEFGIQAEVTGIRKGPVITMFEILPAPGVKLSKIVNLSDNIAMRLASSSVRIVAPIPGKHAVGIEIPNPEVAIVSFAELLREKAFQAPRMEIPIALGKGISGEAEIVDLTRMPHVLIAGATGSGKSVCVNSIICSILYRRAPRDVKMILIDPKIVELKFYNDIPHLLTPVVTDPKRAFQALQYCIYEMERRYTLLDSLQVRDVQHYNGKIRARKLATEMLPYVVVVVDEFADLMATSGKELESTLARLAAMSRAVGIHLVLATQRPSTDVITGLIKANIPSRIAFMVASKIDSRIILDTMGAEKLLGRGDMLFTSAWDPFPTRIQGAFLSEEEVERVVEHVKQLGKPEYIDDEIFVEDQDDDYGQGELEDPLMEKAIDIVVTARKASASYLQRRLKVGYNRAARMVEEMERLGIVGPPQGSKPRDIIGAPDR
jgi:DNA segregation ATPase FtsK/SpoIIIE-like protein